MMSFLKLKIDSNRIYGLDILRAFAILFVMLGHSKGLYPESTHPAVTFFTFDGVSIFFVLSGFLIGQIIIKNLTNPSSSDNSLTNFWFRRWMRTLPNYFLILIVLLIIHILYKENFNPWTKGSYFIFSQNLFTHKHFFFTESWSISVEEWFYILIPLILYFLVRVLKFPVLQSLFYLSFFVIVIVTLFRWNRFYEIPVENLNEWDIHFRRQVSTRLDSVMFGVLAAAIQFRFRSFWSNHKLILFIFGVLILLVHQIFQPLLTDTFGFYECVFSFSVISLGVLLVLPFLSEVRSGKGLFFRFFTYISLISYSLYLVNWTLVHNWIVMKIPWESIFESELLISILKPSSFWIICIFISVLLYKYFELPVMNLRDKIGKKNKKEIS